MRLGSYRPQYDIDFSTKGRVSLLTGHPSGDTQLLNLGTVCFTHTKRCSPQIKIAILFEYPVYTINRTMFYTYEWFWLEILESCAKTRLYRLTGMQLVGVICIHSTQQSAFAKLCRLNKTNKEFAKVRKSNNQVQHIKHTG